MTRFSLLPGSMLLLFLLTTTTEAQTSAKLSCASLSNRITDIYCFDLTPTPSFRQLSGFVVLHPSATPFGISVLPDGTQRYNAELHLHGFDSLPDDPAQIVSAWATTQFFEKIADFGEVTAGQNHIGEIAENKFIVFVGVSGTGDGPPRTVLRGGSPSTRLQGHDAAFSSPLAALNPQAPREVADLPSEQTADAQDNRTPEHNHQPSPSTPWPHPPMHPGVPMAPGMMTLKPTVAPFDLGLGGVSPDELPEAMPRKTERLVTGDTLDLTAGLVRRTINGRQMILLGYNGQYPGPLIRADEQATIVVRFHNMVDAPTAVHWHGIRIENEFDGVPGITQEPVQFGETFEYRVQLPDPGLYWYHPHHREDIFQELGLYGNLLVDPVDPGYYRDVSEEEVLVLDDILLDSNGTVSFGRQSANYMFMGRFGNIYLLNGSPDYQLELKTGSVVRFYLTNVSNTRTFNLNIDGASVKVIASDVSRFEREEWVKSIVMAPAERYIVEARFDSTGTFALTNAVQAVNHSTGTFFPEVDTLGFVSVRGARVSNVSATFDTLRVHEEVVRDIDLYRSHFSRKPDKHLVLTLETSNLPPIVEQTMSIETVFFNPVEWSGTMPMMNWASSGNEVEWILEDGETGSRNMSIDWDFSVGDVVKIRLQNDREAFHAMQHPLHIHGQRFLVLSQNGSPNDNLVWKDTVLLPSGSTTDLLLDVTNPGTWMVHCHIAEHLESGMKMIFNVR